MLRRWCAATEILRQRWAALFEFQLWYVLLVGLLASAAIAWLSGAIVRSTGNHAVTNYDLVAFFLSVEGLAFLLVVTAAGAGFKLVEWAGVLLLTTFPSRETPGPFGTLRVAVRNLPRLVWLGLCYAVVFGLLALPFVAVAAAVAAPLLAAHDINYYLYDSPPEWERALGFSLVLAVLLVLVAIVVWIRLLFAVPLVLYESRGAWSALRGSWSLSRGRVGTMLAALLGWRLVTGVSVLAVSALLVTGLFWLLDRAGDSIAWVVLLVTLAFTFSVALSILADMIGLAGEAALLMPIYREAGGTLPDSGQGLLGPVNDSRIRPGLVLTLAGSGLLLLAGGVAIASLHRPLQDDRFLVTAHRAGAGRGPENTLAALRHAIEDGADYAEIDVQTTRDGELVVLHDADCMRVAGDARRVKDLTLAEIRSIDVGKSYSDSFVGEHVPTFREMLDLARDRIKLNVELKYNRPDPELAEKVVATLVAEKMLDQCVITSLDQSALRQVKTIVPEARIGLIVTEAVGDPVLVEADFLALNQKQVTERLVRRAHSQGKQVHAWTVNDADRANAMIDAGVDCLITDRPSTAIAIRQERGQMSVPSRLALRLRRLLPF